MGGSQPTNVCPAASSFAAAGLPPKAQKAALSGYRAWRKHLRGPSTQGGQESVRNVSVLSTGLRVASPQFPGDPRGAEPNCPLMVLLDFSSLWSSSVCPSLCFLITFLKTVCIQSHVSGAAFRVTQTETTSQCPGGRI